MTGIDSALTVTAPNAPASVSGSEAGHTVVWLQGDHDICTVAALSETMEGAIGLDDRRGADLVVDLSGVCFMDARTVGVIVGARNRLRLRSRSLALRAPSACAKVVLDVCGLNHLLDSASS